MANKTPTQRDAAPPAQRDASPPRKLKIRSFENVKALTEALTKALTMTEPSQSDPADMPTNATASASPTLNPPANVDPKPKKPSFFFYGSLMDPDVLYFIARTSATDPQLHKASIRGYKMKKWGCYPTLVPAEDADAVVHGVYWQAEDEGQLALLQRYETNRYRPATCEIRVEGDGRVLGDGVVFVWAGDKESRELVDGGFSLEEYRLLYKPDVFKRDT